MSGDAIRLRLTAGDPNHREDIRVAAAIASLNNSGPVQFDLEINRRTKRTTAALIITGHTLPAENYSSRIGLDHVDVSVCAVDGAQIKVIPKPRDHAEV